MKLLIKLPDSHNVTMFAAAKVVRGTIVYYEPKGKGGVVA